MGFLSYMSDQPCPCLHLDIQAEHEDSRDFLGEGAPVMSPYFVSEVFVFCHVQ